jgi:hypothetical protein
MAQRNCSICLSKKDGVRTLRRAHDGIVRFVRRKNSRDVDVPPAHKAAARGARKILFRSSGPLSHRHECKAVLALVSERGENKFIPLISNGFSVSRWGRSGKRCAARFFRGTG